MSSVDIQEFLDEFFEEFQFRVNSISSETNDLVRKDMLYLLVENLILKYENKIQPKQGLIKKIFPFLSSTNDYDEEFERKINKALDNLQSNGKFHIQKKDVTSSRFNLEIDRSFHEMLEENKDKPSNLPTSLSNYDKKLPRYERILNNSNIDDAQFSKTNIPNHIEIALELDLLEGKGQDHVDYFVLNSGAGGIIITDGVTGDGELSTLMAQTIPNYVISFLKDVFQSNITLSQWKSMVRQALEFALSNYSEPGGASTFLLAIVDPNSDQLFTAWLGDGNMIYFNDNFTGFSKLLTPHQDVSGQLTRAVTSEGILGKPSVQILSASAGSIILSSDGWHLSNGGILRHFFQKVLKSADLGHGLKQWTKYCCGNEKFHPEQSDDRSIAVIRWQKPNYTSEEEY